MAINGYKYMDPDLRVFEPGDLWTRYLEPRYRDQAPVGADTFPNDMCMMHEGRVISRYGHLVLLKELYDDMSDVHQRADRFQAYHERGFGPDVQLKAMDEEGIDVAVLYPTRGFYAVGKEYDDDGLAAAVARAYNNTLCVKPGPSTICCTPSGQAVSPCGQSVEKSHMSSPSSCTQNSTERSQVSKP